jgi:DNA polymerase (family 10)
MTNKHIAQAFDELSGLMELHEADAFRVRSYQNAYATLRKLDAPLSDMDVDQIKQIKGIGPAIASKIQELIANGKLDLLEQFKRKTPVGVVEMLGVNGFGPKKVRVIWKDMGIETIGELLYACYENRLVHYKGFGLKTQEDLRNKLEFALKSRSVLRMDVAEEEADFLCAWLSGKLPGAFVAPVGAVRRLCPVVQGIEVLVGYNGELSAAFDGEMLALQETQSDGWHLATLEQRLPVVIHRCMAEDFGSRLFRHTGTDDFVKAFAALSPDLSFKHLRTEQEVFEKAGMPYVPPELRESPAILDTVRTGGLPTLVDHTQMKGVLHVHTTYSDGLHSLREMCMAAKDLGYQYIGITDHSQSAFYAGGLKPERVLQQMAEIDTLNAEMAPFRILKGIESDILNDGSLDYEDALLDRFDFVIASVHSNLRMDKSKATGRLLKAIEHPRTTILGHPTGRLLLTREGYPLEWSLIFDACARHNVAIELNANPHRLDIDYTLIPEAIRRGVRIAINPDAHSMEGLKDVRFGLSIARKGGLTTPWCLNCQEADQWLVKK